MSGEEKPYYTSKPIQGFSHLCSEVFDVALATHGFVLRERCREKEFPAHIYQKARASESPLHITIRANTHPRDAPNTVSVELGEGSTEWPERDWNGIALWHLVAHHDPERVKAGDLYGLRSVEDLRSVLEQAARDLLQYGQEFLSGELTLFRSIRAKISRDREPYQWHIPDSETGKYRVRVDEESRRLKQRFSREGDG
jgi:hypothetical protein